MLSHSGDEGKIQGVVGVQEYRRAGCKVRIVIFHHCPQSPLFQLAVRQTPRSWCDWKEGSGSLLNEMQ
jgi:hypothetical protein